MIRARSIVSVLACAGVLGCPKAGTVPSWDDGGGAPEGVMAAHDPAADGGDAPSTDPTEAATGDTPVADASAGEGGTATPPADTGSEPVADPTGEPVADPTGEPEPPALELPKPLHTKVDSSCGKDEGLGTKLKAFDLKSVDGKATTNKSLRGRVALVNFWGTWCKPCLKELPEFDQLYRRYRKHGMTLVAIATDEDPAPVKEFIDKRKLAAKVLIGAEDYAGQYGSPKFPFSFVVDDKGVIRASYRGYRPECLGKLEADLRKQLEARAAK
ncbi:MAG: redoxin family protein [Nannocystaceae bacterium]|nr:redoxin family protein [Nannocystaceae bacterium]